MKNHKVFGPIAKSLLLGSMTAALMLTGCAAQPPQTSRTDQATETAPVPASATPSLEPGTGTPSASPAPNLMYDTIDRTNRNPDLPNVVLLDAGGTITSEAEGRAQWQSYASQDDVDIRNIYDRLEPEISQEVNVSIHATGIAGSSARTTHTDLLGLTKKTDEVLARDDVDAVVINTGTNIMEELAYWSDLTVQSDKPVVFTGSMRQANTLSFDGEANLFNALRLAASQETRCYGTVLMLNDEFFAAREVTKTDAVRVDTFGGGRYGALGTIDEERVRSVHAPARVSKCGTPEWKTPFDLTAIAPENLANAEIAYSYIEADRAPIDALVAAGVKGIVTAGHGAGGISTEQQQARAEAIEKGVLFVSTTRTGSGSVYDSGAEGIIGGADLLPQKARTLLQLALTFSDDSEQIREWFLTLGMPEFGAAT
jgi:L-asparaginase